jgi:predicted RNA-binding protein
VEATRRLRSEQEELVGVVEAATEVIAGQEESEQLLEPAAVDVEAIIARTRCTRRKTLSSCDLLSLLNNFPIIHEEDRSSMSSISTAAGTSSPSKEVGPLFFNY